MNEKVYTAEVRNLIALCHILDEFEDFTKDLSQVLVGKHSYNYAEYAENSKKLCAIANGNSIRGAKKIKAFYQNNAKIIDKIKEDAYLWDFIINLYTSNGKIITNTMTFFYQYFISHKENIKQILSVLYKIKELGFERLTFDENADFTNNNNKEYKIYTNYLRNSYNYISYFENMEAVPHYQKDIVVYRALKSNYKISFGIFAVKNQITLNSLLFDVKKLPEDLTKEFIINKIISLKVGLDENYKAIQHSVDLAVSIDDLTAQFNSSNNIIQELSNSIENKEELRGVLTNIKVELDKLQTISANYNKSISEGNSYITEEMLQEEKEMYLKRRHNSSIDGC